MDVNKAIGWFIKEYPYLVEEYKRSNHHYDQHNLNPFHYEGDVWTHLCMVLAVARVLNVPDEVKWALFVHDIGKPTSEYHNHDSKRVAFKGHDGLSFWMGEGVLRRAGLSEEMRKKALSMVSLHSEFFAMISPDGDKEPSKKIPKKYHRNRELFQNLIHHSICDGMGRFFDEETDSYGTIDIRERAGELLSEISDEERRLEPGAPEIIILSGLPCSGKSTWVKGNSEGYVVISRDALVEGYAERDGISYDAAWEKYREVLDGEFNRELEAAIAEKKNIIVDKTHTSPKSRRRSLGQVPKEYKKTCKLFVCDFDTLMKREGQRSSSGKNISMDQYIHLMTCFKIPMYDAFDQIDWIFT